MKNFHWWRGQVQPSTIACLASCTKKSIANDVVRPARPVVRSSSKLVPVSRASWWWSLAGGSALTISRAWRLTSCPFTPITVVRRESVGDPRMCRSSVLAPIVISYLVPQNDSHSHTHRYMRHMNAQHLRGRWGVNLACDLSSWVRRRPESGTVAERSGIALSRLSCVTLRDEISIKRLLNFALNFRPWKRCHSPR